MKPIFLLGMPSSGKSTLGRSLARLLKYEFVDLDKRIESQEGLTISELFALRGEDYFRKAESDVLKSLPVRAALVVSTGEYPAFFDNLAHIKAYGLSVFLDLPPALLAQRMLHTRRDDRPLYRKTDPDELLATLQVTYENRLPYYRQADIIVTGETTAEHLLETLRYFGVG